MASFHPRDPSWDTVAGPARTINLIGPAGAHIADVFLQSFGLAAFLFPLLIFALGWKWIRSEAVEAPVIKLAGSAMMVASACVAPRPCCRTGASSSALSRSAARAGFLIADSLKHSLNLAGSAVVLATALVVSTYLVSSFTLAKLRGWFAPLFAVFARIRDNWRRSIERRREEALRKLEDRRQTAEARALELQRIQYEQATTALPPPPDPCDHAAHAPPRARTGFRKLCPGRNPQPRPLRKHPRRRMKSPSASWPKRLRPPRRTSSQQADAEGSAAEAPHDLPSARHRSAQRDPRCAPPSTNRNSRTPPPAIKAKFEEFNVFGSVVQINPGPVVTTFEFKPEAGIKYSRITTLVEDLCLGLQAESILIERIPGKPTIGIEVPNTKREVISLARRH